jgi:hypothetical protein
MGVSFLDLLVGAGDPLRKFHTYAAGMSVIAELTNGNPESADKTHQTRKRKQPEANGDAADQDQEEDQYCCGQYLPISKYSYLTASDESEPQATSRTIRQKSVRSSSKFSVRATFSCYLIAVAHLLKNLLPERCRRWKKISTLAWEKWGICPSSSRDPSQGQGRK